ncbi:MAG: HAD-IA family hydrolase [Elusimicrobia bacterium]|nr:HAD-IA family hydrolase [Elusimicrobiota bacterium]MBK8126090.1 HAD-IA family hydrolase [Elusimicrobiota bacterium]MBK8651144.1 HAD-IA family hydrolase [Elusimicrobiota bacterium]MBK9056687.1 HAD-IA family hydrolase [Elusimicrobiota bacterium]
MERKTGRPTARVRPPSSYRAVFFDAGNTLLRAHPSVGHIYTRVARKHGVRPRVKEVEASFLEAWKTRHGVEYLKSDRAEKAWWQKMVQRVMGRHFPAAAKFHRYFEDLYGQFAHPAHWRYFDDALPTLRALRGQGFRVGVVSNWDTRLVTLAERMGLTKEVEFLLVSSIEGMVKPDRRLFHKALKHADVRPHEAVHVGDSLHEDYHGAVNAGLAALLLDRHDAAPAGIQAVRSLSEVLDFVVPKQK